MIKCPSCAYENVDGTQFCEGCGEELAAAGTAGAAASASAPAGTGTDSTSIKCPACENINPPENVVCEVCGTELRPAADTATAGIAATGSAADFSGGAVATGVTPAGGAAAASTPFDLNATPASTIAPDAAAMPAAASTPFDSALPSSAVATAATTAAAPLTDDMADIPAPQTGAPQVGAGPIGAPPAAVPDISSPPVPAMPDVAVTTDAAAIPAPAPIDTTSAPVATVPSTPATAPATGGNLQPGQVKMVVEQGMSVGKQFVLGDVEMLVGREDEEESIYPDIDLSDQDEGYVHRRHATLKFENGTLSVTHLGGANKTRINNRPLPDNEAQPVNIGDKVAFGKVVLRVQAQS